MLVGPLQNILLAPKVPIVTLLDVRENLTDLTTYTFSAMNMKGIGTPGPHIGSAAIGEDPTVPARHKAVVIGLIAGEDAISAYTISGTPTLGGVNSTVISNVSATGVSFAGIVRWTPGGLADIANTDVAVTFSEVVTGCAVALVHVDNLTLVPGTIAAVGSGTTAQTAMPLSAVALPIMRHTAVCLWLSVNDTGTAVPAITGFATGATNGVAGDHPHILHFGANAEFAYMFGYTVINQTDLSLNSADYCILPIAWSAGNFRNTGIILY